LDLDRVTTGFQPWGFHENPRFEVSPIIQICRHYKRPDLEVDRLVKKEETTAATDTPVPDALAAEDAGE
jgi:hypothetical protein